MTESTIDYVSGISTKLFGKAMKHLDEENGVREFYMGRIFGIANKAFSKVGQNGEVFEGLSGSFELETHDGKRFCSGNLYPPNALAAQVISQFEDSDGNFIKGKSVTIAFGCKVKLEKNAAGFTWVFTPLMKIESDPLSLLRSTLDENAPKQLDHKPATQKKDKAA